MKNVNDICFWNYDEHLLTVAVQNENSIKFVRLLDWQVVFSKEVAPYNAVSCLKAVVINKKSRSLEEKFIVCEKGKTNNRIILFEF